MPRLTNFGRYQKYMEHTNKNIYDELIHLNNNLWFFAIILYE
jgi:hypothetical protein